MKKIAILSIASLLFVACNTNSNTKTETTTTAADGTKTTTTVDTHNSKNSLDYKGTYTGELPTASGTGMKVKIELGDDTYKKEITYNEEKETFKSEGKYTWNNEGSIITLEGEEAPNKYKVGENTLTQLDINGNDIKSETGLNYTLKK